MTGPLREPRPLLLGDKGLSDDEEAEEMLLPEDAVMLCSHPIRAARARHSHSLQVRYNNTTLKMLNHSKPTAELCPVVKIKNQYNQYN